MTNWKPLLLALPILTGTAVLHSAGHAQAPAGATPKTLAPAVAERIPALTDRNFRQWQEAIRPNAEESSYTKIAWKQTLWEGLVEAERSDKPLMLFMMNGHPFGCV